MYYKNRSAASDGVTKVEVLAGNYQCFFFIEIMGKNLIFAIFKRGPPLKKNYAKGYPLYF